jgi:hypothetical protein
LEDVLRILRRLLGERTAQFFEIRVDKFILRISIAVCELHSFFFGHLFRQLLSLENRFPGKNDWNPAWIALSETSTEDDFAFASFGWSVCVTFCAPSIFKKRASQH